MEKGLLSRLLRSSQTILTFKDIALILGDTRKQAIASATSYYVRSGELFRLRRGVYAKDKKYNKFELGTKIYAPSYVSFETVLAQAGVIFQYYSQIFVASYQTREIRCDNQNYSFRKIKNSILTNPIGIENKNGYFIASPERAFLDVVYLNRDYHFDNLAPLDWKKVFSLLPLYGNRSMQKRVEFYYNNFKQS